MIGTAYALFGGLPLSALPKEIIAPFSAPQFMDYVIVPIITIMFIQEDQGNSSDAHAALEIMLKSADVGDYFQNDEDDDDMEQVELLNHQMLQRTIQIYARQNSNEL